MNTFVIIISIMLSILADHELSVATVEFPSITSCRSWMIEEDNHIVLFTIEPMVNEDEIEPIFDIRLLDVRGNQILAVADSPCP